MIRLSSSLAAATLIVLVSSCGDAGPGSPGDPSDPSNPSDNPIAFVVDGNVATMREDGSNRVLLTTYAPDEFEGTSTADWSPDGTELLGMRVENSGMNEKIVVIAGDGSGVRDIDYGFGDWGLAPGTWSPDGARVSYYKAHASHGQQVGIYTNGRLGGDPVRLQTDTAANPGYSDVGPRWSPDGSEIAFVSNRMLPGSTKVDPHVFVVDAGGSGARLLFPEPAWFVAWAPDGQHLAIMTVGFSGPPATGGIYVIDRDGGNPHRLSEDARDAVPTWSPDGTRLAFVSLRDDNEEIYVMKADGTEVRRLTDHPARDVAPTWSSDGTRLAFQTDRDGNWEIYAIGIDGTGLVNLTRSPAQETGPRWR